MSDELWQKRAERLLRVVEALTYDRNRKAQELERLGLDHEIALNRIAELEALNTALQIELYRLKRKPDKKRVGVIAAAISGAAVGALSGFTQGMGTAAYEEWRGVTDTSLDVAMFCGVPPSMLPEAPRPEASEGSPERPSDNAAEEGAGSGSTGRAAWGDADVIGAARGKGMRDGDYSPIYRSELPLSDADDYDITWFTEDQEAPPNSRSCAKSGWDAE